MAEPTTKAEVLDAVCGADRALHAAYTGVGRAKMEEPGVNDGWSIKDEIAHLTFWNQTLVTRLEAAAAGIDPDTAVFPKSKEEIDAWNARRFAESKTLPLDAILNEYSNTFAAVIAGVEALPEADLFDASRFAWTEGQPLERSVAGEIYEHYPEHIEQIERWVAAHGR
jgi:hypothetical protein